MDLGPYYLAARPFYRPAANETNLFAAAAARKLPVMLKGPTGCGKSRFVEAMAFELGRPLITVACHEDMTAADLAGRFLLENEGTVWADGPLTTAVRHGAICYLDEIVEARQDTTVVIHPLADHRRVLPLDRNRELVAAHPDFLLVISYNPGYQSAAKDLKESTKQRFVAIDFTYPEPEAEAAIVAREAGVDPALATLLVDIAGRTRNLRGHTLGEGASTRMLIQAGALAGAGIGLRDAIRAAVVLPLTDDADLRDALDAVVDACLP
ncbi:MAG: CbbQ/NirQ/NorQ/GpvN family protein [Acetobacteraceae bacterium]|nr:CbbQ/NirQ/NorQ/GpvN family protein [Acetobacteraceae bacterium]